MTTLIAGRSLIQDLLQDLRRLFRTMIESSARNEDAASTGFSWPRGL